MNFNSFKSSFIAIFVFFSTNDLLALPLPIPNISIQDIFKHGKRAIEKNKSDKQNQQEYEESQRKINTSINESEKDIIDQKNILRKKFNGDWTGAFSLKSGKEIDISCEIKIKIKNFEGKLKSSCNEIEYELYLFINLDRNLENSFIKTSIETQKLKLFGDVTSFQGNNKKINVRGNLEKFK